MNNIQIIPAILATSEKEYQEKLEKIESSKAFEGGWVQIDIMDNKFVQNLTISADIIGNYHTSLQKEAHLMVVEPLTYILSLKEAGVKRVIFHLEAGNIDLIIKEIKSKGMEVGIALNPEIPVEKVVPFIGTIDLVLIMSVHPGFSGQEFIPETVEKVKEVAKLKERGNFLIEVDGGVNEGVAKDLVSAGADNLVIGSHLINGDITENLEKIWESILG